MTKYLLDTNILLRASDCASPRYNLVVTIYQIKGKRIHDARLMAVAIAYKISHILTFNPKDFTKIQELTIVQPDEVEAITRE